MSLYNISTQQSTNILNADANHWSTGDLNRISSSNVNKSNSSDDSSDRPLYASRASESSNVVITSRISADSVIVSSDANNLSNKDTLPDPLANFTYSYYDKISLAKYWKPINNVGDRPFRS